MDKGGKSNSVAARVERFHGRLEQARLYLIEVNDHEVEKYAAAVDRVILRFPGVVLRKRGQDGRDVRRRAIMAAADLNQRMHDETHGCSDRAEKAYALARGTLLFAIEELVV